MTIPLSIRRNRVISTRRPRSASGFTLTEILVAIALIVIIVGVAVVNLNGLLGEGQASAAKLFVTDGVQTPLFTYKLHTGSFPTTDQGLQALLTPPDGVTGWHGPYVDTLPYDPWQHPYQYMYPGVHNPSKYDCWSLGPDGQNGTEDDIGNW